MDKTIEAHQISGDATLLEALGRINRLSGGAMTLFVTQPDGALAGTLTDGDIRRALLRGIPLQSPCRDAMHTAFLSLFPGCDAPQVVDRARQLGISLLPRLDGSGRIASLLDLRLTKQLLPMDAVLMAGGKGERLRPLTLTVPKPLLKVGPKAIIDYNIDELAANGISHVYVTVNYLHEKIEEHFAGRQCPKVTCVLEPKRLGTLGSLALVPRFEHDNILVMNSDLLTTISFADMWRQHVESDAALTIAAVPYTVSVPFAIMRTDGDRVTALEEKPTYNYFANAGVYILRRDLVGRIIPGEYLDAPTFIGQLIADGLKVGYFPIDGTWIDIGSPDDFKNAQAIMGRRPQ